MDQRGLCDLTGRIAAVIGGGSGIGEAVAAGAAAQGALVTILDANESAAERVAARIGGQAGAGALDIRDRNAVGVALSRIARDRGRLDIVIYTPSINVRKPILEDRKSTRLNSSHIQKSRMPSSA